MTLRGNSNKTAASKDGNSSAQPSLASAFGKSDGQRHGSTESSGAESWRSTDTVRRPGGMNGGGGAATANAQAVASNGNAGGGGGGVRGTPMKVNTNKHLAQYVYSLLCCRYVSGLHTCMRWCQRVGSRCAVDFYRRRADLHSDRDMFRGETLILIIARVASNVRILAKSLLTPSSLASNRLPMHVATLRPGNSLSLPTSSLRPANPTAYRPSSVNRHLQARGQKIPASLQCRPLSSAVHSTMTPPTTWAKYRLATRHRTAWAFPMTTIVGPQLPALRPSPPLAPSRASAASFTRS